MSSTPANSAAPRVDQFLMASEARFDRWRALLQAARSWEKSASQPSQNKDEIRAALTQSFAELRQWEDFFAYPGQSLLKSLEERIASNDAIGTARLVQSISTSLVTHSYRSSVADWESGDQVTVSLSGGVPGIGEEPAGLRPYFEVLVVSPARPQHGKNWRRISTGCADPKTNLYMSQCL